MVMWLFIFGTVILLGILSIFYLISRMHRFSWLQTLSERHKLLSWVLAALPVAALGCFWLINMTTMFVVLLHLMFIWMLCDFLAWIFRKITKKQRTRNYAGAAAICLTAAVLCVGWYNAHHVSVTSYQLETNKDLGGPLRVVLFADSHLGITLDGEKFTAEMEKVQAAKPDLVIIGGDFVDDDSTKADMLEACAALGQLETTYGVCFIYGNHDNGYYNYRDFDSVTLRTALEENGVVILEDEAILIDDRFYLVGRQDAGTPQRADAQSLTAPLDLSRFVIMADHQPNDYANETESGADLVVSGHTHGGPIFPAGQIGLLFGANDRIYGTETREHTTFLVTSGISGWAIPFKTGTFSEICVIDIQNHKGTTE